MSGIELIYSGLGVKADEIIKEIAASTDEEILVISSDREITSFARRRGQATLASPEFEMIVNKSLMKHDFKGIKDEEDDEEK